MPGQRCKQRAASHASLLINGAARLVAADADATPPGAPGPIPHRGPAVVVLAPMER